MDIRYFRDNIRLQLTGGLLELELEDSTLDKIISAALVELQRYINSKEIVTIPYSQCIDLSSVKDQFGLPVKISSISRIYRTQGNTNTLTNGSTPLDPMYVSQWQVLSSSGNMRNFQDYVLNYAAWSTMQQIRNTLSTDLVFRFDKMANKLYVATNSGTPTNITIEYTRRYDSVDEITSDYWIDILLRLSVALSKVAVGRIRTRYKINNNSWEQDGDKILSEGVEELKTIRDYLQKQNKIYYPID